MPLKPKPTRIRDGRTIPSVGADPALQAINLQRRNFAVDEFAADIAARRPTEGRFVRVRDAIMENFGCHKASAERTIREAKIYLSEQFERDLPTKRAEMCAQLQRIADTQEEAHPVAAVAALRELSKIIGLYAPKKLEVTHGTTPELALQLDAILGVLTDAGRAALDVVMQEIEAAKREGRLLPAVTGEVEDGDDVEDAELVDDPPGGN